MPHTVVVFYQERPGETPVLDWLRELRRKNALAYQKCVAGIERLGLLGHGLRRPLADLLRDGIYELRIRNGRVMWFPALRLRGVFAARLLSKLRLNSIRTWKQKENNHGKDQGRA